MAEQSPEEFSRWLLSAAARTPKATVAVVRRGAINVERDAKRNVRQTAPVHNAHAHRTITNDVEAQGTSVVADIGYDRSAGRAAALGNLLEFGGGGDHSPPHRDLARALEAEDDRFVGAIRHMGEELLDGRGR